MKLCKFVFASALATFAGAALGAVTPVPPVKATAATPKKQKPLCNTVGRASAGHKAAQPEGCSNFYTDLHDFDVVDGTAVPTSLIQATDGYLYGTTTFGGTSNGGTIFRVDFRGNYTDLHDFSCQDGNGCNPGPVIQGPDGNLWGTTANLGPHGGGTLFQMNPATQAITTAYAFQPTISPFGALSVGGSTLYGVTANGGVNNAGTLFSYDLSAGFHELYEFQNSSDNSGDAPTGVILASDGSLYGMSLEGCNGSGAIWKWDLQNSQFTGLYCFQNGGLDAGYPKGGFVESADGNLYAYSSWGGTSADGAIIELNLTTQQYSFLWSLDDLGLPDLPVYGAPVVDAYGDLIYAGSSGNSASLGGVGFITLAGSVIDVINFSGSQGNSPNYPPLLGSDGNLYGTTLYGAAFNSGDIYELDSRLLPPIALQTSTPSVPAGGTVEFQYAVNNAFSNTAATCFLTDNIGNNYSASTAGVMSVPAPPAPGTYVFGYSCGGTEAATTTITVTQPTTVTTISAASGSVAYGASDTFTITVAPQSSSISGTPTGTVTLSAGVSLNNMTPLGTVTLTNGQAVVSRNSVPWTPANYIVQAAYNGDSTFATSSGSTQVTVQPVPTPTVTVQFGASAYAPGAGISVNVSVAGSNNPTGRVTLSALGHEIGSYPLSNGSTGTITLPSTGLPSGTYTLHARYSGDYQNTAAYGSGSVSLYGVSVSLVNNSSTVQAGADANFTVTVTPSPSGGPTPTGSVQLMYGNTVVAIGQLTGGSATLTPSSQGAPAGTYAVRAVYSGDTNYPSGWSSAASVTVTN